jgi:5-methylcytosine-specific restriction endonuclease McrA
MTPEELAERHRKDRETLSARRKAYRRQNPEVVRAQERERQRRRYVLDPKKFNDYQKEWRARNPEKAHLYVRVASHKRRVAAAGTSFTTEEWLAVVAQYDGRCAYCGEKAPLEIEHKIPLSRGGTNSIDNIVPSYERCNRRKRAKTDAEFREIPRL